MTQLTEERVREIFREEIEKAKAASAAALEKHIEKLTQSRIPENPWGVNPDGQDRQESKVKKAFLLSLEQLNHS
ncbi:hypothetical protein D3C74_290170 [compost metagenome]